MKWLTHKVILHAAIAIYIYIYIYACDVESWLDSKVLFTILGNTYHVNNNAEIQLARKPYNYAVNMMHVCIAHA